MTTSWIIDYNDIRFCSRMSSKVSSIRLQVHIKSCLENEDSPCIHAWTSYIDRFLEFLLKVNLIQFFPVVRRLIMR